MIDLRRKSTTFGDRLTSAFGDRFALEMDLSVFGDQVGPHFFRLLRCDHDVCWTRVDDKLPVINTLVLVHLEDHLCVTRIHSPLSFRPSRGFLLISVITTTCMPIRSLMITAKDFHFVSADLSLATGCAFSDVHFWCCLF